jgi:hypothetical protein
MPTLHVVIELLEGFLDSLRITRTHLFPGFLEQIFCAYARAFLESVKRFAIPAFHLFVFEMG